MDKYDPGTYPEFVNGLKSDTYYNVNPDLEHAAWGVMTEAAEIADIVRKHKFYGRVLDHGQLTEEAGDLLFFVQLLLNYLNVPLDHAIQKNMAKLGARYPNGRFEARRAIDKNIDEEYAAQTHQEMSYDQYNREGPVNGMEK